MMDQEGGRVPWAPGGLELGALRRLRGQLAVLQAPHQFLEFLSLRRRRLAAVLTPANLPGAGRTNREESSIFNTRHILGDGIDFAAAVTAFHLTALGL